MTDEPVTNPELGHQMPKSTRKRAANLNPRMESARPPRSKATRARTIEPAARKQAILDAALTVFSERGFEAARLDDIAVRAGVAKGTLYLYFDDKEGLFEEVVRGAVPPFSSVFPSSRPIPTSRPTNLSKPYSRCFKTRSWGLSASS
jgi:Bacterial regulatory proteins, tetR family